MNLTLEVYPEEEEAVAARLSSTKRIPSLLRFHHHLGPTHLGASMNIPQCHLEVDSSSLLTPRLFNATELG